MTVSVYNVFRGEGVSEQETPYGATRELYSGEGIELVSVTKAGEEIDPDWFS